VTTDLNTLVTALYVKIDDEIGGRRWLGRPPLLTGSELVCLAVAQALLGCNSGARWLRFARAHLAGMFPYLPQRSGYNRRLRAALPLIKRVIRLLATGTGFGLDNVWIADSTPVECGRSRPTVQRSALAGWANYGYCAWHSRWFWGLRLYLIATPAGMPVTWALADPKLDEREVLAAMLEAEPGLAASRPGLLLITDKGFKARWFQTRLGLCGIELLRPSMRNEQPRPGEQLLKPVRQLIESVNDTLKGQLGLGQHGGRTFGGVAVRIARRILAMATASRVAGGNLTLRLPQIHA
jgi:Transposase DDE domain